MVLVAVGAIVVEPLLVTLELLPGDVSVTTTDVVACAVDESDDMAQAVEA